MRVGLIARSEDRGLGILSREVARHLQPDRTLIVIPDAAQHAGLTAHLEWFEDYQTVHYNGRALDETRVRRWLAGLDVVLTAETFYDWRVCDWARDVGARTVCWVMPEYFGMGRRPDSPVPDRWWAPTSWRLPLLPEGTRQVEVPVPIDRWPDPDLIVPDVPRWLHVAGAPAPADRNGTRIFFAALRFLQGEHRVILRGQDRPLPIDGRVGPKVHVEVHQSQVGDYWRLYDDADALVLPRRYGGLSLPALEAMGAGLALLMPDVEPQASEWPIIPLPARSDNYLDSSGGRIDLTAVEPIYLAGLMDGLTGWGLPRARERARGWAEAHSWERLKPTIEAELEAVCE